MSLSTDQNMMFGGTSSPCALCAVRSVGKLGVEENKALSKTIVQLLSRIGVPDNR